MVPKNGKQTTKAGKKGGKKKGKKVADAKPSLIPVNVQPAWAGRIDTCAEQLGRIIEKRLGEAAGADPQGVAAGKNLLIAALAKKD